MRTSFWLAVGLACWLMAAGGEARGQSENTAFSYQGRLTAGGSAAEGSYDFSFVLFAQAEGGTALTNAVTRLAVPVKSGLFEVWLDYGPGGWFAGGEPRYLEVWVRTNGNGRSTRLLPRQMVGAAPRAQSAREAAGMAAQAVTTGMLADGAVTAEKVDSNLWSALSTNSTVYVRTNDTRDIWLGGSLRARALEVGQKAFFTNAPYGIALVQPNVAAGQEGLVRMVFATNLWSQWAASVWWMPNHGEYGGEVGLTSDGNVSLNPSYGQQNSQGDGGGIQLGSSGAFHDRMWVQYDDNPGNVPRPYQGDRLGRSKLLEFRSRYRDAAGVATSRSFGFRQEMQDTNGNVDLVLYSQTPSIYKWPGTPSIYGTNGVESGGVILGRFKTNGLAVFGSIEGSEMRGGGYAIPTNSVALWPSAPRTPGEAWIGNSNGVIYLLTSRPDAMVWVATNRLGQ